MNSPLYLEIGFLRLTIGEIVKSWGARNRLYAAKKRDDYRGEEASFHNCFHERREIGARPSNLESGRRQRKR